MSNENFQASWGQNLNNKEVRCQLCPRECLLKEGQRGFCFVRQNIDGNLILTTYGRSSGFCIDPIEKKPLYHFYPGSPILSFGTAGCNLGCLFCQNWNISKSKEFDRLTEQATPKQIAEAAKKRHCPSVAFTYNDPVIFTEYAIDVAKECHNLGVKTVAVTAGYINPKPRKKFFEHIDAANVDLKAFSENFYEKFCLGHLDPVLDTLKYIKNETKIWLEITTLIIPSKNDSDEELDEMTSWIAKELGTDVPIHFSAFHPSFKILDISATPKETLTKARAIALKNGLRYVYTGNVNDDEGSSTYCPNCKKMIIQRFGYTLVESHIKNKKCIFCNTEVAGYFTKEMKNQ
ncbi:MAG: AmmeMemoRadiSam system radical SAM enzyme [Candidatus Aceula meridiana]|nr:AmmeMemoRadiSam system radical SAM enzyme [Candidatus Aceula meridiana]